MVAMPLRAKGTPKPELLLAHKWEVSDDAERPFAPLNCDVRSLVDLITATAHTFLACLQHKRDPTGWHMSEKLDGVRAFWNGSQLLSRLGNPFAAPEWFTKGLPVSLKERIPVRIAFGKAPAGPRSHVLDRWKSYQQTDETLDGELFVGRGKFSATVSIVKTSGTDRWKQVTYMVRLLGHASATEHMLDPCFAGV